MKNITVEKVIQYTEFYSVLFSNGISHTIAAIFDSNQNKVYYSEYKGISDLRDFIPGGPLYLSDDLYQAIENLRKRYESSMDEAIKEFNKTPT